MENNTPSVKSRILYQSSACIVINKLIGEAVEGASGGMIDLQKEIAKVFGEKAEVIEAVHRLDVPVTGCALFALTKTALSFLNAAFAGESSLPSPVEKTYWAVIEKPSRPLPESGELIHWIETNSGKNKSIAHKKDGPNRKKAALRYRITGEGRNYLFLEVQLLSGRHHQIRAQFAAERLHIKGDLKYGAKRSEKNGGIRLHARSLSFPDPLNKNEIIRVTADPPQIDNLWESFITTNHTKREESLTTNHTNTHEPRKR
jgi:23S rRNA pseudouridine1911/1915/1917 synthase